MKQSSATVPGKLYIAGEYAVVTPGYPAMLMTVDRFLSVKIKESNHTTGTFKSTNYSPTPFEWDRVSDRFEFKDWSHPFYLLKVVIQTVEHYVDELNIPLQIFDIEIHSELDYDGKKIGLGSSGAVTIAMIKALLDYYEIEFTHLDVYKLAAIAHVKYKSNGSFGDLAACAFTGIIAYTSFDKEWLNTQLNISSYKQLLKMEWPHLTIERVPLPKDLTILVGWTGKPASTENLVETMYQSSNQIVFNEFLKQSQDCVFELIDTFKQNNTKRALELIQTNRQLLIQMGRSKDKVIETPELSKLCQIANQFGGSGKSSGAGGGDCGIALIDQESNKESIINTWEKAGIQALNLTIYTNGVYDGQVE